MDGLMDRKKDGWMDIKNGWIDRKKIDGWLDG